VDMAKVENYTFKGHKFILYARCPQLLKDEQSLNVGSILVIKSFIQYIYTDKLDSSNLTIKELFELWKLSILLLVPRLEILTRLTIRKTINTDNAVDFAACAFKFNLKSELYSCLQLIQQNPIIMRDKLKQHPDIAIDLVTTSPTEFPVEQLEIPPSTLVTDFNLAMNSHSDLTLVVKDSFGNSKSKNLHTAVVCHASPYFKALLKFKPSSIVHHESPIPLEAFETLTQSWYTGVVIAKPIDCFYLILSSEFYFISDDIIKQCLEQIPQLKKADINDIVDVLSLEILDWLLASKYLECLCDEETRQRVKTSRNNMNKIMSLIEKSPIVLQLRQQIQSIQDQLQKLQK